MLGPRPDFVDPERTPRDRVSGIRNLKSIRTQLRRHKPIDLMFFSGGGNDVVDNLAHLIRPYEAGLKAQDALLEPQVTAQMKSLRRGYEYLLGIRNQVSPNTLVFSHNYGVPNLKRGALRRLRFFKKGPWIRPGFAARGYCDKHRMPTPSEHELMTEIIGCLMARFSEQLNDLARFPQHRFFVGETRAVLKPNDWRDEMHLTRAGFNRASDTFRGQLESIFDKTWLRQV